MRHENNSLAGLAEEYRQAQLDTALRINSCRRAREKASRERKNVLVGKLDDNIRVLTSQYAELGDIAKQLERYYVHSAEVLQ